MNVGGRHVLAMADLQRDLEALGLQDVRTYIQSGNVVFHSPSRSARKLGARITAAIEAAHGLHVPALVLSSKEFAQALEDNPFQEVREGNHVHFSFLFRLPQNPNQRALTELASPTESFARIGRVFYLHAPEGIARSKLAASAGKHLGVELTSRNLSTVRKLARMLAT